MIDRPFYLNRLSRAVKRSPITALIGPRQCGKTTLARMFAKGRNTTFFDLESQVDLNRLQNPQLMLGSLKGLVIIDEIQAMPEAIESLNRAHLWIIHPGEHAYPLSKQISVWPMRNILALPEQLR